jgi:hypothetical protein
LREISSIRKLGRKSHITTSSGEGFAAWAITADETIRYYKSSKEVGLTAAQVQENTKYGLNVFPALPGKSIFEMITDQFKP